MVNRNPGEILETRVYNVTVVPHSHNGRIRMKTWKDGVGQLRADYNLGRPSAANGERKDDR
jgi:hypothetical protein